MPPLPRLAALSCLVVAAFVAASAGAVRADEPCVWGEPGYRDCVDRLLEAKRQADAKAQSAAGGKGEASAPSSSGAAAGQARARGKGKSSRAAARRPGAGSLTPVPPAELRITPPRYDALEQAITSERRQRQMDENLYRTQRDTLTPPIMPPPLVPPYGRICPPYGC